MITNERQYRITRSQLEKFKKTLDSLDIKEAIKRGKPTQLAKAELNALQSEIENLTLQVREYESLKSGEVEILKAFTLEELPEILIRARIAKGLSQSKLAELLGLKEQQIQRYESEEYAMASLSRLVEIANVLELNISEIAQFKKSQQAPSISYLAWDQFPIREMFLRNWFEDFSGSISEATENAEELLKEFVGKCLDEPIKAFARQRIRLGGTINPYALIAWQCRVINLARKIKLTKSFNKSLLLDEWFENLIKLSRETDGPKKAVAYLQEVGIRLVIVPHLSKTHLDGAAILLTDGPAIGMTLRYDKISNFWFVLIHELIHIKKHLCKGNVESIFDDLELENEATDIEKETDEAASEMLIPNKDWETALARYVRSEESVKEFADKIGISPAIVAGKIQKEAENYIILKDIVGQGEVRTLFPEVDFSY